MAKNSTWAHHMESLLAPKERINRTLKSEAEPGLKPIHSDVDSGNPSVTTTVPGAQFEGCLY